MADRLPNDSSLQRLVERFHDGDSTARDDLIRHACERLRQLTHKMLRSYPGVHRWEQTDDVLNGALLRLLRALEAVRPDSEQAFLGLATEQIRRQLLDLARHYFGPQGVGANHESNAGEGSQALEFEAANSSGDAARLAEWSEFHEQAAVLPEPERDVFGLLYYQGLKQVEAADCLGVSVDTIQRRWFAAMRRLRQALNGEIPGSRGSRA